MKHITEASDTDLANAIVGVGVQDTVAALRAAFDFSPVEEYDPAAMKVAAGGPRSAKPLFPQPTEGVAELIAELGKYAGEFNYGDYSQKLVQRTIAALSTPQRPTPSDEELLAAYHGDDQHNHLIFSDHAQRLRAVAALEKGEAE